MKTFLKDLLLAFLFSKPAAPKRRRLRKLGEMASASAVMPAADEPRREAKPPADERRVEVEVEEVTTSPPWAATSPFQQEAVEEETATEA